MGRRGGKAEGKRGKTGSEVAGKEGEEMKKRECGRGGRKCMVERSIELKKIPSFLSDMSSAKIFTPPALPLSIYRFFLPSSPSILLPTS
jgi:hypothetical protein